MTPRQTNSMFLPITAGAGADQELKKRQSVNAQIDFLQELANANKGNDAAQKYLLQQYFGLISPEEQDTSDSFGQALDLITLGQTPGYEQFGEAGKKMLSSMPGFEGYFTSPAGGATDEMESYDAVKKKDQATRFSKEYMLDPQKAGSDEYTRNFQILQKAKADPSLIEAYYGMQPSFGQRANMFNSRQGASALNPFGLLDLVGGNDNAIRRRNVFGV